MTDFYPNNPIKIPKDEIAAALRRLIADPELRLCRANAAYARAQTYSWEQCAGETFAFIAQIAQRN